jgi:maltooligosyltrehalose trehalohydrolase
VGYYKDFGNIEQMAKAYTHNFVYTWNFSRNRQKYHGSDPSDCSPSQFVVFSQNHDQVGNRIFGDRLCHTLSFEAQKLAAAAVILSPSIPLIFMGEEYGETAPFQYFVSHTDPELVAAVRKGRKYEFAAFHAEGEATDPQAEETFQASKLHWEQRHTGLYRQLWLFYQMLLRLRREVPAWSHSERQSLEAKALPESQVILLRRWYEDSQIVALLNFDAQPTLVSVDLPTGKWKKLLGSADTEWGGSGSELPETLSVAQTDTTGKAAAQQITLKPQSVVVYSST